MTATKHQEAFTCFLSLFHQLDQPMLSHYLTSQCEEPMVSSPVLLLLIVDSRLGSPAFSNHPPPCSRS